MVLIEGVLIRIDSAPAAQDPHAGTQIDGVVETVRAGQDVYGPAAQSRCVVNGRLDRFVGDADQISLPRADGNGEAFAPVRLEGVTRSSTRAGDRGPSVGGDGSGGAQTGEAERPRG